MSDATSNTKGETMKTWKQTVKAYQANTAAVRNVFDGFFSPGLISRMCVELNTDGRFDCCETRMQAEYLDRALNGEAVVYNPELDPELAECYA